MRYRLFGMLLGGLALSGCSADTIVGDTVCRSGERVCLDAGHRGVCRDSGSGPDWVSEECGTGTVCRDGACRGDGSESEKPGTGDETPECSDMCGEYGVLECVGTDAFRKCSNFDDDPCLEWSGPQACDPGMTCRDGVCVSGGTCRHACDEGMAECAGDGYRTCLTGTDGCRRWSDVAACGNGCENGRCVEKTACTHQCENGAAECVGGGRRICVSGSDGCRRWSDVAACDYGCEDGRCLEKTACTHQCGVGESRCSGSGFITCVGDADGCRVWSGVTKCSYGCGNGKCLDRPPAVMVPTRYPGNRILSPVTPYVVECMKKIRAKNDARKDDHFMKMGDSHMYSESSFMYCFSKDSSKHRGCNLNGLPFDAAAEAFQTTFDSFKRVSDITILGETAFLPIKKDCEKLNAELKTTNPRFAFFGYGSNDMGFYDYRKFKSGENGGYFAAMQQYYRNVLVSVRSLVETGVIPLIIGTGWRTDTVNYYGTKTRAAEQDQPRHYVTTFNAVSRGIAEYYQIPYYNLQLSHQDIPGHGLGGDGLHHTTKNGGCDFTPGGLGAGANMRNRYAIEMLDRAWRTTIRGEDAPDGETVIFEGKGTRSAPFIISSLPYTHMATTRGGEKNFNVYSCSQAKENGPEHIYKMNVSSPVKIRAFAVSDKNVDVDIHLLNRLSESGCTVRGDKWIEAELSVGTHYFVVDTFSKDANAGIYLFGIHACDPDDTACGAQNIGQ